MRDWPIPGSDPSIVVRVVAIERAGPWSSLSIGIGTTDDGRVVTFVHGEAEMRWMAASLAAGVHPLAEVPCWAVLDASRPGYAA